MSIVIADWRICRRETPEQEYSEEAENHRRFLDTVVGV